MHPELVPSGGGGAEETNKIPITFLLSFAFRSAAAGSSRRHTEKQETWSLIQSLLAGRIWLSSVLDSWTQSMVHVLGGRKWVKVFAGLPAVLYYYYYPFRGSPSAEYSDSKYIVLMLWMQDWLSH